MNELHWLGHRFPISNAKTQVSILKEKKLAIVDKIFAAYNEARICIRNDLVRAASKLFCSMYLYVWTEAQIICRVRAFLNINQGVSWSLIKVFSVH
ncbi:hypothetical protein ACS0TY_024119 [Phlomoides rotata]